MTNYGLYQLYITTSTTTVRTYYRDEDSREDIELDDTAPLPLFIGIGLALFIGFVILVLICCCCRRRSPAPTSVAVRTVPAPQYQRAPVTDGMTSAYPLGSVPPMPYPNSSIMYPPSHQGHSLPPHTYGVVGTGVNYNNMNHNSYLQQTPHFAGVAPFPSSHYAASLPLGPHTTPLQSHSPSHSSQASSSVSGATADPLVPPSFLQSHQPPQYHHHHPYPQLHYAASQHMPPPTALQHHQHLQQQYLSGRQSPSLPPFPPTNHTNPTYHNQGGPPPAETMVVTPMSSPSGHPATNHNQTPDTVPLPNHPSNDSEK